MPKKAVIAVIVIAIILIGGFFLYKTWQGKQQPEASQVVNQNENASWKTYKNDQYGFSFEYPKSWLLNEPYKKESSLLNPVTHQPVVNPTIVEVISPKHKKELDEGVTGPYRGEGSSIDFIVAWCESINTTCAAYRDDKGYSGIEGMLADNEWMRRSSFMSSVNVGGKKGYGVVELSLHSDLPNFYKVMVDYKGIYILEFPSFWPGKDQDLTPEQQHILSSFRFTK